MVVMKRLVVTLHFTTHYRKGVRTIHLPDGSRDIHAIVRYILEEVREEKVPIMLNPEPIRVPVQVVGGGPTEPIERGEEEGSEEVVQK